MYIHMYKIQRLILTANQIPTVCNRRKRRTYVYTARKNLIWLKATWLINKTKQNGFTIQLVFQINLGKGKKTFFV
jgi:hypothetical protein